MKTPEVRRTSEIIGVAAIVLTLLFLGYELKRSNDIAETEASSFFYAGANEFIQTLLSDRELLRIWSAGQQDAEALSDDDKLVFMYQLISMYNQYEQLWKAYENGVVSEEDAKFRFDELCAFINAQPVMTEHFFEYYGPENLSPGFIDRIVKECGPAAQE